MSTATPNNAAASAADVLALVSQLCRPLDAERPQRCRGLGLMLFDVPSGVAASACMLFDVPSGVAVSRFGDKGVMVLGTAMVAVVAIGASLSKSVVVLAILMLVMGGGWAFWQLARLAYVSEVVPIEQRGRALSLVGGVYRLGLFLGPILGGFLGKYYGLGRRSTPRRRWVWRLRH